MNSASGLASQAELLVGGTQAFEEICRQIDSAQQSIEINIFIWRNDELGRRLAHVLLKAAGDPSRPNLRIRIVKDSTGSAFEHAEQNRQSFFHPRLNILERFKAFFVWYAYHTSETAKSGKQLVSPLAQQIMKHPRIECIQEKRNDHSKYFIFDDRILICGGMNIAAEYCRWHDYMVKFEGEEVVRLLQQRLKGEKNEPESSVRFIINSWYPGFRRLERREIKPELLHLISQAEYLQAPLTIEMSYLGDREIIDAVLQLADSGIEVNLIIPQRANVQEDLNRRQIGYIHRKIRKGIIDGQSLRIFYYPGMLHAKLFHVGEIPENKNGVTKHGITCFGSSNINKKSLLKLAELNIYIDDAACSFTRAVKQQLRQDMQNAAQYMSCFDQKGNACGWEAPLRYDRLVAFVEGIV